MKIGVVGDLHIAPPPSNRIDDYFQVGLNKIEEIAKECDYVIFLGDIFTQSKVDEKYVNALIKHLRYCKTIYNCNFKTIIGNHDVISENEDNLEESSLGILKNAEVISIITPDNPHIIQDNIIYRFNTIPVNYKKAKQYLTNIVYNNKYVETPYNEKSCMDILLVHHEYETGTNCFTYNDFKDKQCKMIFLGHDHKPFEHGRIIYPEFTIYRSGSIMRNRADDYNFTRQLYYYIIENGNVSCKAVTTSNAQSVFKVEAITKQNYNKQKFIESLDKVIEKYKNNASQQTRFSIKNILKELNADQNIIDNIEKRYQKLGEVLI